MSVIDLTLRPPPPLGYKQALIVIGATAAVMLFAGLRFWAVGAWVVVPFLVVDLALLIWAFKASARGSKAYERLRIGAEKVLFERVAPTGHSQSWEMPRLWTRWSWSAPVPVRRSCGCGIGTGSCSSAST